MTREKELEKIRNTTRASAQDGEQAIATALYLGLCQVADAIVCARRGDARLSKDSPYHQE